MVALLGAFRRERNGQVADTMHYDGARYGLNYGVSLPTVRRLVRAEQTDHAFACFLLAQQVRELQLAALHLADPDRLADPAEAARWCAALVNTELAEEAAFACLCRSRALPDLFERWLCSREPLTVYAALLAAARAPQPSAAWIGPMCDALRRIAADRSLPAYAARRVAEGAVALAARLAETDEAARTRLCELSDRLGSTAAEHLFADELAWRLPRR